MENFTVKRCIYIRRFSLSENPTSSFVLQNAIQNNVNGHHRRQNQYIAEGKGANARTKTLTKQRRRDSETQKRKIKNFGVKRSRSEQEDVSQTDGKRKNSRERMTFVRKQDSESQADERFQ